MASDPNTETEISVSVLPTLGDVDAAVWDACAAPECRDGGRPYDPFTTHRFLHALETSGSVGPGTGWEPQYLLARAERQVIAAAPLYGKSHSQGEYIFDHNWAHAYEHAGGRYYPKLQIAVPFTPATGRRLLVRPQWEAVGQSTLIQAAVHIAKRHELSSVNITFCTESEREVGETLGLLPRSSQQYHWQNNDYADFDEFLGALSSRKRKTIRKERSTAQDFGGEIEVLTGTEIEPHHWDAFWLFYQDTGARKWGAPYLTRAFFDLAQDTLRNDLLLVMVKRDGRYVAGALNVIGRDALFGRYWGCLEHHPCLHFEVCYYQAIDWAIRNNLSRVEAGAQGDHKLARGYMPVTTHSLHWLRDPGLHEAVAQFLRAEAAAVAQDIEILTAYGPFRNTSPQETI